MSNQSLSPLSSEENVPAGANKLTTSEESGSQKNSPENEPKERDNSSHENDSDPELSKSKSLGNLNINLDNSSEKKDDLDALDVDEKQSDSIDISPPVYLKGLCAYLGATAFMGYTACINAIDYFHSCCPGHPELSQNVARILNFCAVGAQIICFPFVEKIPAKIRILVSQFMYALCFLFLLIYPNVVDSIEIGALYTVMAVDGVFFGILMTSVNGFCGLLSRSGAPYAIIGNALAGIFSTALRLISKAIGSKGEGWFYFGVCFVIIALGEIFLFLFTFTDYYNYRMKYAKKGVDFVTRLKNIFIVIKKCWLECLQALLINATAYILFPGYATQTLIKHGIERSWITTIVIACYMVGDFVGRTAARWWKWPSKNYVIIAVCLRFLFFPLYCISIENIVSALADEIWICVLTFFLPFSGGYFLNLSQAYTCTNEKLEPTEQEIASFTVSFFIGIGTTVGCLISYAMPIHDYY